MTFQTTLSKIGVAIGFSIAVTFSHAALDCKDVKYDSDNYHENMAALAIDARLIDGADGYFSRYHETVVSQLCGHSDDEPPRDCRRLNILREYDNKNTKLHS